jgi:hypothetical protein
MGAVLGSAGKTSSETFSGLQSAKRMAPETLSFEIVKSALKVAAGGVFPL